MKIGLLGFGKAGKAVANVILQHKDFSLEWILKKTDTLNKLSAKDILGISASDDALIYSQSSTDIETLLEDHPVDFVIDFSNEKAFIFMASSQPVKRSRSSQPFRITEKMRSEF